MSMEGSVPSATSDDVKKFFDDLDWKRRGRTLNTMIRAGAGAGKTTELVARVLSLAIKFRQEQERFPRLVVTTFTRKATQELKERLLAAALKTQDAEILRYIQQSRSLQVSTIHGTLQRFLMLHGSVLGLSPDFQIIDDGEYHWMRGKILRRLIEEDPARGAEAELLLEDWSLADFWSAFEAWEEARVLHQNPTPETADHISEKREEKLKSFESKLRGYLQGFNDHKLTDTWKTQEAVLTGGLTETSGKSSAEKLQIWQRVSENRPSGLRVLKSMDDNFKELHNELKEDLDSFFEYRWSLSFEEKMRKLLPAFESLAEALSEKLSRAKISESVLAKSDLEAWTLKILRADPSRGEQFGKSWDYWMIDEFQDTSPLQVEILSALAGAEGRGFYVGDPQQSIYLFRGARSEVFFQRESEIEKQKGEKLLLMTNYRSSPPLMTFLNDFLPSFSNQFAPMQLGGKDRPWPHPQAVFWEVPKQSEPKQPEAEQPDEDRPEDLAVLARVQELLDQGVEPSSICVLSRNNENLREFSKLATKKGLAFHWGGDSSFADRSEIRDALAFLKFLASPHDNINLLSLLRSPWFYLGDGEIQKISQTGQPSYYRSWERLVSSGSAGEDSKVLFKELSSYLKESQHRGVSSVWLAELLSRKFVDVSYAIDPSGRRESNFWKLIAQLRFEERDAGFSLLGFIEKLEDSRDARDSEDEDAPAVEEPSRVQLMTIHASKGLQFDHVILGWAGRCRFAAGASPMLVCEQTGKWSLGFRSDEDGVMKNSDWGLKLAHEKVSREVSEFDRFLYVAFTRAKLTVSAIWSASRTPQAWPNRWNLGVDEGITEKGSYRIELRKSFPEVSAFSQQAVKGAKPRDRWKPLAAVKTREYVSTARPDWLRFTRIQDGVRIHRWMEALKYSWDQEFDSEIEKIKEKLESFPECDLRQLIENGEVEWSFMVQTEKQEWVPGRIDFWGKSEDGKVWVLDYKTGSSKYRDKALLQLKIYTWALYKLGQIPEGAEVRLLPLFLFEEESKAEVCPSREVLEAEIDSWLASFRQK